MQGIIIQVLIDINTRPATATAQINHFENQSGLDLHFMIGVDMRKDDVLLDNFTDSERSAANERLETEHLPGAIEGHGDAVSPECGHPRVVVAFKPMNARTFNERTPAVQHEPEAAAHCKPCEENPKAENQW